MKENSVILFMFLSICLSSHAEISKSEFEISQNTQCVLGGNFELIKEKSLKPALLIYSCGGDYCKNADLLASPFRLNLEKGQLLLAIILSPEKSQVQSSCKAILEYINSNYSFIIDKNKIYEISNIILEDPTKTIRSSSDKVVNNYTGPELILTPKQGCLPVKYGMNKEQIVDILGEPDQYVGKHCLDYTSTIGLSLLVHSKKGLLAMDCWSQDEKSDEGLLCGSNFVGKFPNGISIGSGKEEIEKAFGENSVKGNSPIESLAYPSQGVVFMLKDGKVSHISMQKPR